MSGEETPRNNHRSGEWTENDEMRAQLRRIEKKLDDSLDDRGDDRQQAVRVDERLKVVETWIAEKKQFGIGAWLSVIGAVASPIAVIVFEMMRSAPH